MALSNSPSMLDGLHKMLGDLAKLGALPDADLDFLTKVQMVITNYLKSGSGDSGSGGGGAQPTPPGADLAAGGTGMMGGAMPQGQMPNADELRRVLAGGGPQGGGMG